MVVTELVTKFGFKGNINPLKNFNLTLGKGVKTSSKFVAGIGAAALAVGGFMALTLRGAKATSQLSKTTGLSFKRIQELGYAAGQSGSDMATMEKSLSSLNSKIGNAFLNGDVTFARLGINVRKANGEMKKTDEVMYELADRFKNIDNLQVKQSMLESLGIDQSLLPMLEKGRGEMERLSKSANQFGLVSKKQQKDIDDFNNAFNQLTFASKAFRLQLAAKLAPILTFIVKKIEQFKIVEKVVKLLEPVVKRIFDYLKSVDWDAIFKKINDVVTGIVEYIKSIDWEGIFKKAGEVLKKILSIFSGDGIDFGGMFVKGLEKSLPVIANLIGSAAMAWGELFYNKMFGLTKEEEIAADKKEGGAIKTELTKELDKKGISGNLAEKFKDDPQKLGQLTRLGLVSGNVTTNKNVAVYITTNNPDVASSIVSEQLSTDNDEQFAAQVGMQ